MKQKVTNILIAAALFFGLLGFGEQLYAEDSTSTGAGGSSIHDYTTGQNTETQKLFTKFGAPIYEKSKSPAAFVGNIIYVVLGFLGVLVVSIIIYAGFLWTTSAGEEKKLKLAQGYLVNAVIGAAIIISAWTITRFVLEQLARAAAT